MNQQDEYKRIFFGFDTIAPWPKNLPDGRMLEEQDRHLTVAFLGETHYPTLEHILPSFPLPKFKVGLVGKCTKCLFLPPRHPNVVAWHIDWLDTEYDLGVYQTELVEWLQKHDFSVRVGKRGFTPHVTLCRRPFNYAEWKTSFRPLPIMIKNIHLYESIGNLKYQPLWTHSLIAPFEAIPDQPCPLGQGDYLFGRGLDSSHPNFEKTPSLREGSPNASPRREDEKGSLYVIRGENIRQIYIHSVAALAFRFPSILEKISEEFSPKTIDAMLSELNTMATVESNDEIVKKPDGTLMWKFILTPRRGVRRPLP